DIKKNGLYPNACFHCGEAYFLKGDYVQARSYLEEALQQYQTLYKHGGGNEARIGEIHLYLSQLSYAKKNNQQARVHLVQVKKILERTDPKMVRELKQKFDTFSPRKFDIFSSCIFPQQQFKLAQ